MLHKIVTATMCLVSSVAIAGSIELSVAESEAYQGYTRLQHQHLQLIERVKDVEVTTNFDRKGYENGKSAVSAELMLAKTWNDSLYTLTRAAITNDDTIFINNALYNEFGLKVLKNEGMGVDLGVGIGTREFPIGQETFAAFGPTLSLEKVGLWLRREQSLDGGGYRHSISAVWYPVNALRLEVAALDEKREKFILPTQGTVVAKMSGQRYTLKAAYDVNTKITALVGIEDVEQKRDDLNLVTYAPTTLSVGVMFKY